MDPLTGKALGSAGKAVAGPAGRALKRKIAPTELDLLFQLASERLAHDGILEFGPADIAAVLPRDSHVHLLRDLLEPPHALDRRAFVAAVAPALGRTATL